MTKAVLVAALFGTSACNAQTAVQARPAIRILAGPVGGGFRSFTAALVREYARALPSVEFTLVERRSSVSTVEAIQQGHADLAVALADVAYLAFVGQFQSGSGPFSRLRGLSALDLTPLHLVVRADSAIQRVGDLRGHSVGVPPPSSENHVLAEIVLKAFGVDFQSIRAEPYSPTAAAARFVAGDLDAMLYPLGYPAESVVAETRAGGRLLPIDGDPVKRLVRDYRFLQLARIPAGIYPNNPNAVRTIGVTAVLLCRSDLDEDLVYQLTRQFFEMIPSVAASLGTLRFMDLEHASATPIPLHDGAARYYRERELLR
jgi:TRAP transporter TAXI family solute receptor